MGAGEWEVHICGWGIIWTEEPGGLCSIESQRVRHDWSNLACTQSHIWIFSGDQPWDFFGGNDAEAETPVLWPPHAKSWLIVKDSDAGRDWGQEEEGTTEDEMAGWHPWLDGRESEWTLGVGYRQGGLACCDSWGRKSRTRLSDWTELNWTELRVVLWKREWQPPLVFLPGESHGQWSLAGNSSWGRSQESDTTEAT